MNRGRPGTPASLELLGIGRTAASAISDQPGAEDPGSKVELAAELGAERVAHAALGPL